MVRIVSGGQTGVDRGALDAALESNTACGGWVPDGRKAEDGTVPARYPVQELAGGDYRARTLKNLQDSDGTVIIYFGQLSGGTQQTLRFCLDGCKPYLLIDAQEVVADRAAERIVGFLGELDGSTLNFAGPRASSEPRAHGYTKAAVMKALEIMQDRDSHNMAEV